MAGKASCEKIMNQLEQTRNRIREMIAKNPNLFPGSPIPDDPRKEGSCGKNGYIPKGAGKKEADNRAGGTF
ncbi:MAG: hypothetical protein OXJ52_09380 [Oligoflexia bacterium]|nr:hypothetical protein [Oligoflexia bacterium]